MPATLENPLPATAPPLKRLTGAELEKARRLVPDWQFEEDRGGALSRVFGFGDFVSAFAFMTELAFHAETQDHHPEWSNVYNRVSITLTTHDAHGLTARDLAFAQAADQAFLRFAATRRPSNRE